MLIASTTVAQKKFLNTMSNLPSILTKTELHARMLYHFMTVWLEIPLKYFLIQKKFDCYC